MKFNSVLLAVAAALSVAQGAQMNAEANEVVARAAEAEPQGHGPGGNFQASGSGGGSSGGSSGGSGSSNNNNKDCDDDDDDDEGHCNSATGLSLPVFGSVAGLAVAMAALL